MRDNSNDGADIAANEPEDDGIGLNDRGHPLMLRLLTSNQGFFWLPYASITGGRQATDGTVFEFYFKGILYDKSQDKIRRVFGDWLITVKGQGLELICSHIGKGTRSLLKVGKSASVSVTVASIVVEPMEVVPQEF